MKIKHNAEIFVGDYQFAESLNQEVLYQLKFAKDIGHTNVKGFRTEWNWLPDNPKIKNFKSFIVSEIGKKYTPTKIHQRHGFVKDLWANVYKKSDYAQSHDHFYNFSSKFSFSYFVKAKWYDSPLIFDDSGKRIRPKEGRYVIFPSYLLHSVPKNRYNHERVTLSGNYLLNR
ncbi:2OG-Fe(II) oxygenase [Synechococcus phage S-SM2]|uniref:Prolyl 4-hydroxylase alpha subunit Fe(2+) 2OG dioxygenase domain-containing protein n=1 Tax=Synechococcus phage S-SM2 TaxID=444860 RepID=E3SJ21_9CAUD|nr:2OG-Fe(II) oxygenase [Synechococcus phage S-SM2]ADO97469.1 hypothetical protein SSM2_127 [Synechococcus phage S-SM2]